MKDSGPYKATLLAFTLLIIIFYTVMVPIFIFTHFNNFSADQTIHALLQLLPRGVRTGLAIACWTAK